MGFRIQRHRTKQGGLKFNLRNFGPPQEYGGHDYGAGRITTFDTAMRPYKPYGKNEDIDHYAELYPPSPYTSAEKDASVLHIGKTGSNLLSFTDAAANEAYLRIRPNPISDDLKRKWRSLITKANQLGIKRSGKEKQA